MAIDKIQSESINLADTFAFTGAVTGAGESNIPYFDTKLSSNQICSDNTSHRIEFATVVTDTASGFTNTSGNYKYTIPSGQAGKYLICYGMKMNPTNGNRITMTLYLNGSATSNIETDGGGGSTYASQSGSRLLTLAAGDVLHCEYFQNSSVNSVLTTDATYFSGFKLTATT